MSFGKKLQEARMAKGYSIRTLARMVDRNATHISKVERDETPLSDWLIIKLAEVLDQSPDEFMIMNGRIPGDVIKIIQDRPKSFIKWIRLMENEPDEKIEHSIKQVRDGEW